MQKKQKDEKEKIPEKTVAETEEWKNKYLRALADYHNLENRVNEQVAGQIKRGKKDLLLKLLNVLDNIERAQVFISDKGLTLVKDELWKIIQSEGVTEMQLLDKPYDPFLAECIEIEDRQVDDMVIAVLRKGYMLYDDVLRTAHVRVSKKTVKANN